MKPPTSDFLSIAEALALYLLGGIDAVRFCHDRGASQSDAFGNDGISVVFLLVEKLKRSVDPLISELPHVEVPVFFKLTNLCQEIYQRMRFSDFINVVKEDDYHRTWLFCGNF